MLYVTDGGAHGAHVSVVCLLGGAGHPVVGGAGHWPAYIPPLPGELVPPRITLLHASSRRNYLLYFDTK